VRSKSRHSASKASFLISLFLSVAPVAQSSDANSLPPTSVYHLRIAVENQFGETSGLDLYRGQPVLVTLFYAGCPHVCPMLVSTIKLTESKLAANDRAELRVLAISIDPGHDTPTILVEMLQRHSVDRGRWSMVRTDPAEVRTIAGIFGVKYKKLPDGGFNHTAKIVLLGRDGTPLASTSQLGRVDAAFLEAVEKSLQ